MDCEAISILGDWPILLTTLAVGFVLGAVWMRARYRYMMDRYATLMKSVEKRARSDARIESQISKVLESVGEKIQ